MPERNFVRILREICREEGIALTGYSWDWIFLLEKNGRRGRIIGHVFGLNPASAHEICCDKSAASTLMEALGVPHVEHTFVMAPISKTYSDPGGTWRPLLAMLEERGALVVKDNEGTGGNLVFRVRDAFELENALFQIFQRKESAAVSPWLDIREEYRCIYLDGDLRLVFRKDRPHVIGDGEHTLSALMAPVLARYPQLGEEANSAAGDPERIPEAGERVNIGWKHNLGKGSSGVVVRDEALLSELTGLARRAADCLGFRFASVDIVRAEGGLLVLEVNSGVMMEHFSGEGPEEYRIAKEIYRDAVLAMLE